MATFAYGDIIHGYFNKKAGKGNSSVEWQTPIDKEGMYEIFVYMSIIPYVSSARWKLSQGQEAFPIYQHYTVTHANGTEKIEQNVNLTSLGIPASDDAAWISLGRFKLDSGIHRVNLSDKGNISDFYIYADAVKWVYLEDND